jgi:diaphanous 1
LLKSYQGDVESLGDAEKYFREVMVIPRLSNRLTSMMFKHRFEMDVEEIKPVRLMRLVFTVCISCY